MKKNTKQSWTGDTAKKAEPADPAGEREALAARVRASIEYITLKRLCEEVHLTEEHYAGLYSFIEKRACHFWKYLLLREAGNRDRDPFRAVSIAEQARLLSLLVEIHPAFREKIFREVLKLLPECYLDREPPNPGQLADRLDQCNQEDYFAAGTPAAAPGESPEEKDMYADFSPERALEEDENALTRVHARSGCSDPGLIPDDLRVYLRIMKGPNELSLLEIPEAPAYIGRDPLATARIRHQTVSRRHAVISFANHRFYIKDLGSTNGTILNSLRVTESALNDGDILQFGQVVCQFVVQPKKN